MWNCKPEDLVVSFDGASLSVPPETTRRGWYRQPWFHCDQSYLKESFECVQSWVTGLDVNEGDATLAVLEGSHFFHQDFAEAFGIKEKKDWFKLSDEHLDWYKERCTKTRVVCPKGSLVLWDSRTIHCGVEPQKTRPFANQRAVVYLCYAPRSQMTPKMLEKKKKAFQEKRTSSHWPTNIRLFPKTPQHTYGKPLPRVVLEKEEVQLSSRKETCRV